VSAARWEWAITLATVLMVAMPVAAQVGRDRGAIENLPRFLALGDSYTIGEKVDSADRWPVQLARLLRARKVNVADPEIVARTGWTTDELAAGISAAAPVGPYRLVTLLIGVNNQYRGRDAERYRAEFVSLMGQAVEFAGGKAGLVVVLSIPDWGVTPFAAGRDRAKIGLEIDRFNAINREETVRAGARYVDVTPSSREAHDGWTTADGLHPSGAQYRKWAELALDAAALALKN
jgi:lysophospholipase L1-like esterase